MTDLIGVKCVEGFEYFINPSSVSCIIPDIDNEFKIDLNNGVSFTIHGDYLMGLKNMEKLNITVIELKDEETINE